jgi:hypothetical protein
VQSMECFQDVGKCPNLFEISSESVTFGRRTFQRISF